MMLLQFQEKQSHRRILANAWSSSLLLLGVRLNLTRVVTEEACVRGARASGRSYAVRSTANTNRASGAGDEMKIEHRPSGIPDL